MLRLRSLIGCFFASLLLLSLPAGSSRSVSLAQGFAWQRQSARLNVLPAASVDLSSQPDYFHWPQLPVRVFIAGTNSQEKKWARIAEAGFNEWASATGGTVSYTLVRLPEQAQISVAFTAGGSVPGHPALVGITTTYWTGTVLDNAEIVLATGQKTPDDLQTVAAHEFGHALGIRGHSGNDGDLMFPSLINRFGSDGILLPRPAHAVTQNDLDTLHLCYPRLRARTLSL